MGVFLYENWIAAQTDNDSLFEEGGKAYKQ